MCLVELSGQIPALREPRLSGPLDLDQDGRDGPTSGVEPEEVGELACSDSLEPRLGEDESAQGAGLVPDEERRVLLEEALDLSLGRILVQERRPALDHSSSHDDFPPLGFHAQGHPPRAEPLTLECRTDGCPGSIATNGSNGSIHSIVCWSCHSRRRRSIPRDAAGWGWSRMAAGAGRRNVTPKAPTPRSWRVLPPPT